MRLVPLFLLFALVCSVRAESSSVLSPSDHEHSAEISGLFDWLNENGAKVCCIFSIYNV